MTRHPGWKDLFLFSPTSQRGRFVPGGSPFCVGGEPRKDHVRIVRGLFDELKKHPELQGPINYSLLVAMAFLDGEAEPSFGTLPNQHSIEAYIEGAEKVPADRPDVRRVGGAVTKIANALPLT